MQIAGQLHKEILRPKYLKLFYIYYHLSQIYIIKKKNKIKKEHFCHEIGHIDIKKFVILCWLQKLHFSDKMHPKQGNSEQIV